MNPIDQHSDVIAQVRKMIPLMPSDAQLFQAPWQARIFALIVVMVKEGHFSWKSFQSRLAHAITTMEKEIPDLDPQTVESRYFDCWLKAVEETLEHQGFIVGTEVTQMIEDIRVSVSELRKTQLSPLTSTNIGEYNAINRPP